MAEDFISRLRPKTLHFASRRFENEDKSSRTHQWFHAPAACHAMYVLCRSCLTNSLLDDVLRALPYNNDLTPSRLSLSLAFVHDVMPDAWYDLN